MTYLKNLITPDRTANTIRQQRQSYSGTFLIVEGKADKLTYQRFIDNKQCRLKIPFQKDNKNNIIRLIEILEQDNFAGMLAILDADFMVLEKNEPTTLNILLTDTHDLETMILQSQAFNNFLLEFCSEQKLAVVTNEFEQDIRDILLERAEDIGYLRWLSIQDKLNLKFEGLGFKKFVNLKTLEFSKIKMIKTVKNNSQRLDISEEYIQSRLEQLKNDTHNPWHVCCGHDLINVLSIGLQRVFGTYDTKQVAPYMITRMLRLAYGYIHFKDTTLYKSIQRWELANQPFKVLIQY